LFTHSKPPHLKYAAMQWLVRLFGPRMLRIASRLRAPKQIHPPSA
jgi:hypothetical protein